MMMHYSSCPIQNYMYKVTLHVQRAPPFAIIIESLINSIIFITEIIARTACRDMPVFLFIKVEVNQEY